MTDIVLILYFSVRFKGNKNQHIMKVSLSTRQEWHEDQQAEYERDFCRDCAHCGEKRNENIMVLEELSGLWICEECKDDFIKEWRDDDNQKPIFK